MQKWKNCWRQITDATQRKRRRFAKSVPCRHRPSRASLQKKSCYARTEGYGETAVCTLCYTFRQHVAVRPKIRQKLLHSFAAQRPKPNVPFIHKRMVYYEYRDQEADMPLPAEDHFTGWELLLLIDHMTYPDIL